MKIEGGEVEFESKEELSWLATCKAEAFRNLGNPVYAIESISAALKAEILPPENVCEWLRTSLEKWFASEGTTTMDAVMGLTGQVPAFRRTLLQDRNLQLLMDISRLRCLGMTIEEDAYMVTRRLEDTPQWNLSKHHQDIPKPTAATVMRLYKQWDDRGILVIHQQEMLSWNTEQRRNFLSHFPDDSIPVRFRNVV
jgi:hypothetical protein